MLLRAPSWRVASGLAREAAKGADQVRFKEPKRSAEPICWLNRAGEITFAGSRVPPRPPDQSHPLEESAEVGRGFTIATTGGNEPFVSAIKCRMTGRKRAGDRDGLGGTSLPLCPLLPFFAFEATSRADGEQFPPLQGKLCDRWGWLIPCLRGR